MRYDYRPYEERQALYQYQSLLKEIMKDGENNISPMVDGKTGESLYTREIHGVQIKYDILKDGAPIITERDISRFYKGAIGELFGFINGARTDEQLRNEFGCKFWTPWVTEEKCKKRGLEKGDLGEGYVTMNRIQKPDGTMFEQFKEIDLQMRERPELKTHLISPWVPYYTIRNSNNKQKVVVCPCHGWIHFNIINGRLDMTMWQRSCDVILGLPSNLTQYTALLLAMAHTHNLKPGVFCHQISNAHIYNNTFEYAEEMLGRDPEPFPTLKMVNEHDSIFKYRSDDFELEDYHPKERILNIPVGV